MTAFEQKFIENPLYLKWIFNTDQDTEHYWEQYLLEHPEDKNQLLELKHYFEDLRFSNDTLRHSEKEEVATRIIKGLNLDYKQNKHRFIIYSLLKYAAVALFFAAIGGLLVFLNTDKESFFQQQINQIAQISSATQGPLLITSNGLNVELKKSNSTLDYLDNGAVLLNNDSVIHSNDEESNALNQLVIPYGNQSRVVLSDNTVVWLNSGSRLVYPTLFKGKTREVLLFGEAYFEVSKNPEMPFIVMTSDLEIRVLGTQFNISAYTEDDVIQTVLKEGSVAIRRKDAGFFENDVVIKPNQLASFNKSTSNTKIYEVEADYYTLWTKGLMSFEETELIRVIKKVERFYNISVNISDPQKKIMRISGKLDLTQGRKEVIEYLVKVSLSKIEQINENQYDIK